MQASEDVSTGRQARQRARHEAVDEKLMQPRLGQPEALELNLDMKIHQLA